MRLQAAAAASQVQAAAADLVSRRPMSRRDLERKLVEKGASEEQAARAGQWLEDLGVLDDREYAALLVRHYSRMGYGPARLREKLREKGVPRELWDEALETAPSGEEQALAFLTARLHGRMPEEAEKQRLSRGLVRRGFSWGDVRAAWSSMMTI